MVTSTTNDKFLQPKAAEPKVAVNQPAVATQAEAKVGEVKYVKAEGETEADFNARVQDAQRNYKYQEDVKVAELTTEEDLLNFLQRISKKLKNTNSNLYPPASIEVADEIDAYVRKLGNGEVEGYKTETVRGRTYAVKK